MTDIALIDGDIVAWRAASAIQGREIDWDGDGNTTSSAPSPTAVRSAAVSLVRNWTRLSGAHKAIVCLSPRDGNTFRKHVVPGYKSNRKMERPALLDVALDVLQDEFDVNMVDGLEADDVMGITSTQPSMSGRTVIVTIDKDLQSIPGLYFNPKKDRQPRRFSLETANYFWMCQTLIGDPIDGYSGCPGIGKLKAQEAFSGTARLMQVMWPIVVRLFEKKRLTEDDAITQARAARILRHSDYNAEEKWIRLWHPSTTVKLHLPLPSLPSTRRPLSPESRRPPASSRKPGTSE